MQACALHTIAIHMNNFQVQILKNKNKNIFQFIGLLPNCIKNLTLNISCLGPSKEDIGVLKMNIWLNSIDFDYN